MSDALGTSSGHGGGQVARGKLPDDGGRFVALLLVHQLVVALEGAHGLDLAPVDGFLVEFLAQLELDRGVLEGGHRVERVLIALLDQLDRRVDAVAQLAQHHADTWLIREKRGKKRFLLVESQTHLSGARGGI